MLSAQEKRLARVIGRRIRELRHERQWDQVDLEAHLDGQVKRATLSDFETGRRLPSLRTLQRIADAFELEHLALLVLNPNEVHRDRVAAAVLKCPDDTLAHVGKLVDVG